MSSCLGVVGRRSSPRMMWVIAMSRSSMALASANSGWPVDFTATKSSMALCGKATSPRITSMTIVSP